MKFLAHGKGVGLFLTQSEVVWSLTRRGNKASEGVSAALRMKLVNANPAVEIEGRDPLPGRSNYSTGPIPAGGASTFPGTPRSSTGAFIREWT